MDKTVVEQAVREALKKVQGDHEQIKVGVSQRHIHLSREDLDTLFGKGYELTKKKNADGQGIRVRGMCNACRSVT